MVRFCLRLSEGSAVANLVDFFERRGCPARQVDAKTIEVEIAHEDEQTPARRELDLYLRVWIAEHPTVGVFEVNEADGGKELRRRPLI